jgi:7-carboxy-7-deazaguanine synthase
MLDRQITITEIYASIQGESSYAGLPCTFVRTTGCPLRCKWCDTAYAFKGGNAMTVVEILAAVERLKIPLVELTGGEPLAQEAAPELIEALIGKGYKVLIETGGSEPLDRLSPKTHIIMDLKCPGSGMEGRNIYSNLDILKASDEVKFVVASRGDFDWAVTQIVDRQLARRFKILLSCAWGHVAPKDLAAWLVEKAEHYPDDLGICRMQLQQHKYIWGPRVKGF